MVVTDRAGEGRVLPDPGQGTPGPLAPDRHRRNATVGVGAIVLNGKGEVLLGRRIKMGEPESWCLPGGHVEAGESFEQAAVREIAEETGLTILAPVTATIMVLDGAAPVSALTCGVVAAVGDDVEPQVLEPHVFACWAWMRRECLPDPLFPASRALLNAWLGKPLSPVWHFYFIK
nr:NUDIX domain-containing protein [Gluconacetobacter johannae]